MRRPMGMLAVTLVLATLALVMGCGSNSPGTSPGSSVGTAGKPPGTAYTVRNLLADWPDGIGLCPDDLNDSGQIACHGTKRATGPYYHAVLWDNGHVTELPEPAGSQSSMSFSINAGGDIAGANGPQRHALVWRAPDYGTPTDLHQPEAGWGISEAWGINASGEVVGYWEKTYVYHGHYWNLAGGDSDIAGCIGGSDINDDGQVLGRTSGDYPAIWQRGGWGMTRLTLPSGYGGRGEHINAAGHVVGRMFTTGGTPKRAFLWDGSQVRDLGTLPGYEEAEAYGLNDADDVVGFAKHMGKNGLYTYKAFIWRNGVMSDLSALAGTTVRFAYAINSNGQIAGEGPKGGLLLTPK